MHKSPFKSFFVAVIPVLCALPLMPGSAASQGAQFNGNGASANSPIAMQAFNNWYYENTAAADKIYKDKTLFFVGPVAAVYNPLGTMTLQLNDTDKDLHRAVCYLINNADAKKVAVGQTVVIRAKVRGGLTEVLDNCTVVSVSGTPALAGTREGVPLAVSDFVAAYRANAAEADARYKDKQLYFTATLRRLDRNENANALIVGPASGDNALVRCMLEYNSDIDKNRVGQTLKFRAEVPGGSAERLEKCWVSDARD